jgi:Tfp pilus assembly protein PilV
MNQELKSKNRETIDGIKSSWFCVHGSLLGQSLFEVIFAMGLVSIILIAIVALSTGSIRNSTYSKNNVVVTQEAQTGTEWLRSERDKCWVTQTSPACTGFITRSSASGTTWCLNNLNWSSPGACSTSSYITGTLYQRQVVLTSKDNFPSTPDGVIDTVEAVVVVTWVDSQGTHEVRNQTSYTDWRR